MAGSYGQFEGEVLTKWLQHADDDRDMELLADFAYVDPNGKRWLAPKGSVINGASIPQAFWTTEGSPYVGDYRRASVVHDVACVEKSEPSKDVHRMFYNAMLCDGVASGKAYRMYSAVYWFGPSWPDPRTRTRAARDVRVARSAQPAREPSYTEMMQLMRAADRALEKAGMNAPLDELDAVVEKNMTAPAKPAKRKPAQRSGTKGAKAGRKKPKKPVSRTR
jgi:hypothetical protein